MNATTDTLSFQGVTRFLRCQKTGRYFTGSGWTPNQSNAKSYHAAMDVAEACVSHDLHAVDLIIAAPHTGIQLFCTAIR
jgi:hypothetical protein